MGWTQDPPSWPPRYRLGAYAPLGTPQACPVAPKGPRTPSLGRTPPGDAGSPLIGFAGLSVLAGARSPIIHLLHDVGTVTSLAGSLSLVAGCGGWVRVDVHHGVVRRRPLGWGGYRCGLCFVRCRCVLQGRDEVGGGRLIRLLRVRGGRSTSLLPACGTTLSRLLAAATPPGFMAWRIGVASAPDLTLTF